MVFSHFADPALFPSELYQNYGMQKIREKMHQKISLKRWTAMSTLLSMNIPMYPDMIPIDLSLKDELQDRFRLLNHCISELTFADLYLFRHTYGYRIAEITMPDGTQGLVISGTDPHRSQSAAGSADPDAGGKAAGEDESCFAMLPFGFPGLDILDEVMQEHCCIKNFPEQDAERYRIVLERHGYCVRQDRENFDYLYTRKDLAELSGKKYHKKRNLVNAFINNYSYEEKRISQDNRNDLYAVLDEWLAEKEERGDYDAAREAIDLIDELSLEGCITYVDGKPCAYSMGEPICRGNMFAVHFEKAIGSYKGIYQFINQSFASMMDESILYINREQDLGDPGLRQAKMSYRPSGFVKKYRVCRSGFSPCDEENESGKE